MCYVLQVPLSIKGPNPRLIGVDESESIWKEKLRFWNTFRVFHSARVHLSEGILRCSEVVR